MRYFLFLLPVIVVVLEVKVKVIVKKTVGGWGRFARGPALPPSAGQSLELK